MSDLCAYCADPVQPDEPARRSRDSRMVVHERCLDPWREKIRAADRRRFEHERELNLSRLRASFDHCLTGQTIECGQPLLHTPMWDYARFSDEAWRARCHPKILNVLEQWDFRQSMLVLGPTGSGKSSGIVARLYRELERLTALVQETGEAHTFDFAYTTGLDLSGCRRRSKIGAEATLISHLASKRLIIIDEVGFEPPGEELLAVIDRHYIGGGTIVVCSGLTLEAFDARYGGALRRRIVERGMLLNGHPARNKGQVRSVG